MGTLVSPGVSVTITDESFYVPVSSPTVPLFFIATADDKKQANGTTPAIGTQEHNILRTVTSLKQATELYGIPNFKRSGNKEHHGDARNEYGLFALNQFLGLGSKAYVVRVNVNLDDNIDSLRSLWLRKISTAQYILENKVNEFLNNYNSAQHLIPTSVGYKTTVTASELKSLIEDSLSIIFDAKKGAFSFRSSHDFFIKDQSAAPLNVFPNGDYNVAPADEYTGLDHIIDHIQDPGNTYPGNDVKAGEWSAQEAGELIISAAQLYRFTQQFLEKTRLGANDAARRVAIAEAMAATINSMTELRAETFDYNLVLCPGYPEAVDEMLALVSDIKDEALVIADTPLDRDVDGITNPATGWAATTARQNSVNVAYYYPGALASNLDGKNIMCAASGVALRAYAYSDEVSYLWFAPAGVRRGIVTGVSDFGYAAGTLGGPTTFETLHLDLGSRNALYQDMPSGRINPLVFFPGRGYTVWGQKTSAPQPSAMDRVNVSRLLKYIKRQLRMNTLSFIFEPNDALTRDSLKALVDSFLSDLITKRALYDYVTVCDESNNTPNRIDRNELYIEIALKPVKAAEFLYIPINIVNTGTDI